MWCMSYRRNSWRCETVLSFKGYIRILYNHTIQNIASLMYTGSELYIIKLYIMIYTEWYLIARRSLIWILWEASGFSVRSLHVLPVPVWDLAFHRPKICIWGRGELANWNCPEWMKASVVVCPSILANHPGRAPPLLNLAGISTSPPHPWPWKGNS